jgi:hypothetical protein
MTTARYLSRSLWFYRRTHLAAMAGAAIATAALAGALLTGRSVRETLRGLAVGRLGATEYALRSRGWFRTGLAREFAPEARAAALASFEAVATHGANQRRASVWLYGVDDSFYAFHGSRAKAPEGRDALLSPALAAELAAKAGDTILVRVEQPSAIPREFIQGRREETARTIRFRVGDAVAAPAPSEFAPRPSQGDIRAVFVPLARLQKELGLEGKANLLILAGGRDAAFYRRRVLERFTLEDAGLRLRQLPGEGVYQLEHESTLLDDSTALAALSLARASSALARPTLLYVANSIVSANGRSIPYSLVGAADEPMLAELSSSVGLTATRHPPVVLNEWAAADLAVQPGDPLRMEYFYWSDEGQMETRTADFEVAGISPLTGMAVDRDFAPIYPGITDQESLADWDPPFPIDLKRIRPRDELYWKTYRTAPKAWIPIAKAREIWGTRFGSLSSIRFEHGSENIAGALRAEVDPFASQFALVPLREQSLAAAKGSTDFGEYFLYFSFLLLVAALLLMALFFRLAVEQRRREVALLASLGFDAGKVLRLFLLEGGCVACAGSLLGVALAPAYAWVIVKGLTTWWRGATGTGLLKLSLDWPPLAAGFVAGAGIALLTVWISLRKWEGLSPRQVQTSGGESPWPWQRKALAPMALAAALSLLAGSALGRIPQEAGFFGGGFLLLLAGLLAARWWLRKPRIALGREPGNGALFRLSLRNLAWRPGRTLMCLALFSLAAFMLVSLESFRHDGSGSPGTGGFALYAESQTPIVLDPNSASGREALGLPAVSQFRFVRFRLRPGEDVSCLNLYAPKDPRILGVPEAFLREKRFRFAASTGASQQTLDNPWLLLEAQMTRGVIPAIVDQNSMTYVLHKKLGDEITITPEGGEPVRLRLVAALTGSLFQSELLISEKNFVRLFPAFGGHRVFLIDGPDKQEGMLEEALAGYGFDAQPAAERLAGYFRVENTYLSTFQALGAFGLLIGSIGLAAVVLRNALERRRELALLAAMGYGPGHLKKLLRYEMLALLAAALAAGVVAALLAVTPALRSRGTGLPAAGLLGMLTVILACGWLAVRQSVRIALRAPARESLAAE